MQIFKSKPFTNSVRQYINIKKIYCQKQIIYLNKQLQVLKDFMGAVQQQEELQCVI